MGVPISLKLKGIVKNDDDFKPEIEDFTEE